MKNIAIALLAISLSAVQLNFARKVGKNRDGKEFPGRLVKTSSGRIFLDLNHSKREKGEILEGESAIKTYYT